MCRNIKTLFNFEPPATEDEIRTASLQFVPKVSGFGKSSKANEVAFLAVVTGKPLNALETNAPTKNRAEEASKARVRAVKRFSKEAKG